ncbi:DUF2920 family protein, partial [Campylobacter jejuni]|nr:DUF2920 family protein [Campylobacter jejuni]
DGVIDNSGSAVPPLNYIIGRELEFKSKDTNGDMYMQGDHFCELFLKTHWTRKENSPYFLINENYFIRTL